MTTTTSTPTTPEVSAETRALRPGGGAATGSARRFGARKLLVASALAVMVGGYFGLGWVVSPSAVEDPLVFTAVKRTFPVTLLEKGELKAAKSVDVRCQVEGRSTIIRLVPEGTEVKKGDLLVELGSDRIDEQVQSEEVNVANATARLEAAEKEYEIQLDQNASDIRKAKLAVENAETELKKYLEGDWVQLKMDAELAIKRANQQLERAEADWASAEELYKKKFITRSEYLADRFAKLEADIAVKKADLALWILDTYTHPQDLRQKQSDVDEARKDLERVKKSAAAKAAQKKADLDARRRELEIAAQRLAKYSQQQAKTKIYAPADGLVVYYQESWRWGGDDGIKEGSEVRERQTIITLPDTSQMKVEVRIHEATAGKIRVGQQATVEIEGFPGRVFSGRVSKVAVLADSQNRWLNPDLKEYRTEILLEPTDVDLKPGVTARAEIHIQDVADQLAVPIQAVYAKGGTHYVFRRAGGEVAPVEVELGPASTEFAVIRRGIEVGDQVQLAVSDDLQRLLPEPEEAPNNRTVPAAAGGG